MKVSLIIVKTQVIKVRSQDEIYETTARGFHCNACDLEPGRVRLVKMKMLIGDLS